MKISQKDIAFISLAIISTGTIVFRKESRNSLLSLITNKFWLLGILSIIIFSIYMFVELKKDKKKSEERKRIISSYKKAVVAFSIAILSQVGMSIAPFWVVFTFAYFSDGWT